MIRPFNKIRLAYLDELENDPGVMSALKPTMGEILSEWITIKNPKGKSYWPESIQSKPIDDRDIFTTKKYISIWGYLDIEFREDNDIEFAIYSGASVFYYNPEFDCMALVGSASPRAQDQIDVILMVATLSMRGNLPDLMGTSLSYGEVYNLYKEWKK